MRIVFLQTPGEQSAMNRWKGSPQGRFIVMKIGDDFRVAVFGEFGAAKGEVEYLDTPNQVAFLAEAEGFFDIYDPASLQIIVGDGCYRKEGAAIKIGGRSKSFGGAVKRNSIRLKELFEALADQSYEIEIVLEDWDDV